MFHSIISFSSIIISRILRLDFVSLSQKKIILDLNFIILFSSIFVYPSKISSVAFALKAYF